MIPDLLKSLNDDISVPVKQVSLQGPLGAFDRSTGEILIEKDQTEAGKHIILIHEILHFLGDLMIQNGIIKRQPDEKFITHAAPMLLTFLVANGLYTGVSVEELVQLAEAQSANVLEL